MKKLIILIVLLLASCTTESIERYRYWRATYNTQMLIIKTEETTKDIYEKHNPETIYFEDGFNREYFKTIE